MATAPAASAAAPGESSTRERLLDSAARLFYRDGFHVGVEALCREAGVSKRSMYQLFESKDAVVAASLERVAPVREAALLPPIEVRGPRERILHVFRRLEQLAEGEEPSRVPVRRRGDRAQVRRAPRQPRRALCGVECADRLLPAGG